MSFKRNDIVNKQRLRDALEEETAMGFAHNDIVTVYAMDKAIAAGGGGGGDYKVASVTLVRSHSSNFELTATEDENYYRTAVFDLGEGKFYSSFLIKATDTSLTANLIFVGDSVAVTPYNVVDEITGDAVYDNDTGNIIISGDCTISGHIDD